jgi:hypothetical protein
LCVHSRTAEGNIGTLRKLFILLNNANLRINAEKTILLDSKVSFCGHFVNNGYVSPLKEKIKAILELKAPTNKKSAQSLFGLLNYHRNYIKDFASKAAPISKAYSGNFEWDGKAQSALDILKNEISDAALTLKIPPVGPCNYILECDASQSGMGAVIYICSQKGEHIHKFDCLKPCAYFSANFSETQSRYTTFEKELYSARTAMLKYEHLLAGREFLLITDNSVLKFAHSLKSTTTKIQKWLSEISGFNFKIEQRRSADMCISDHLSRTIVDLSAIRVKVSDLADLQKADPTLSQIRNFIEIDRWPHDPSEKVKLLARYRSQLRFGTLGQLEIRTDNKNKLVVPDVLKKEVMLTYHGDCHSGRDSTVQRVQQVYFWIGMTEDIKNFIKSCDYCQKFKSNSHPVRPPLGLFEVPKGPTEILGIDLIGPLPVTDSGYSYVLTGVDHFSKRGFAHPLKSKKSVEVCSRLKEEIYRLPKMPRKVILDNGREFSESCKFLTSIGVKPVFIPAVHPQTNGASENFNRTLKSKLLARTRMINWDHAIFEVVHEHNSSVHSVTKLSPFTIEHSSQPHKKDDYLARDDYEQKIDVNFELIRDLILKEKESRVSRNLGKNYVPFKVGDLVLMKNFERYSKQKFIGPFTVVRVKMESLSFVIRNEGNSQIFTRNAVDLKPYRQSETLPETIGPETPNIIFSGNPVQTTSHEFSSVEEEDIVYRMSLSPTIVNDFHEGPEPVSSDSDDPETTVVPNIPFSEQLVAPNYENHGEIIDQDTSFLEDREVEVPSVTDHQDLSQIPPGNFSDPPENWSTNFPVNVSADLHVDWPENEHTGIRERLPVREQYQRRSSVYFPGDPPLDDSTQRHIVRGFYIASLSEMDKEVLIDLVRAYDIKLSAKKDKASHIHKIKDYFRDKRPDWPTNQRGEPLIKCSFLPRDEKLLNDFTIFELKTFAARYCLTLPNPLEGPKPYLMANIVRELTRKYPDFARKNGQLCVGLCDSDPEFSD